MHTYYRVNPMNFEYTEKLQNMKLFFKCVEQK